MADRDIWLFSYGTLQQSDVQRATFGRLLEGSRDTLPGYGRSLVEIRDPEVIATSGKTHHPIVRWTGKAGDVIEGHVFKITPEELARADAYEVADYKRVAARLGSGLQAFVYVAA